MSAVTDIMSMIFYSLTAVDLRNGTVLPAAVSLGFKMGREHLFWHENLGFCSFNQQT